jgi:isoquinoline 1-oxidoreductase subunit beta
MSAIVKITRRDFLRHTGFGAGALVLGCYISTKGLFATDLPELLHQGIPLNNFVSIELDGTIHITAHRPEMGQGTRSSLAAVLADELEADWDRVVVRQADADAYKFGVPFPILIPGAPELVRGEDAQVVDGSRSMATYYMPMRLFGAGIRLVFVRAAARKFGVDVSQCYARQHKVYGPGGRSVPYQLLLLHAQKVMVPTLAEAAAALKPRKDWRLIGTNKMPLVDAQDMVTGKAVYGADVDPKRTGMLTAMIERCPVANGTLKSFDPRAALAVPGVKYVTQVLPKDFEGGTGGVGAAFIPHAGVAVLAANTWAAWKGRRALKPTIEWDLGPHATYDSDAFRNELETSTARPGKIARSKGDVDSAFAQTARVVEAGYYVPHLAQTPMEPPSAVALYEDGRWEIWAPTQGPELAQHYLGLYMLEPNPLKWLIWQATELNALNECERETQQLFNEQLASLMGVDVEILYKQAEELKKSIRDRVKIHVTLLGGSFGRKSNPDYIIEAAFLARQYPGVPIRVQWTREDDIKFSYYSAVSHQYLKAVLDTNGHPTALLQRSAFKSLLATLFTPPSPDLPAVLNDINASARAGFHNGGEYPFGSAAERSQGLEDMPHHVNNLRIENCPAQSHIRCGCVRSAANIYHAFSACSFADEMAVAAGRDSKDYLLELIGKGYVLHEKDLREEQVKCFNNNFFPVDQQLAAIGGQITQLIPGYPPDTRRLKAVVERVAKESGWDEKVKRYKGMKGRGLGIAAHRSFLSYVALAIDVSLSKANELTINEIYGVIDCGFAVNLDRVRAQMEGGINYGLSIALLGEITVKNGTVVQNNFNDCPVLRIHQAPKRIYTYVEEPSAEVAKDYQNKEVPPTGVGEPPTPVVAPALANAIVAAGGPRIRELPIRKALQVN